METYILLLKLTEQGIKTIKEAPKRIELASRAIEAMGGKMIGIYAVMGEYDYVAIGQIPNAEAGMAFVLGLGAMGNVRTTTLRAFPEKEFIKIVKKLR
jgi:uncharacterized protein with GYD domain